MSRRYHSRGEREDLEQIACLALLKAIERYDSSKGVAFSFFAVPTIIGELERYFRDCGWSVRVPRALQELNLRIAVATEQLSPELGRAPTVQELAERCEATPEHVVEALGLASAHRADSLDASAGTEELPSRLATMAHDDAGYGKAERAADVDRLRLRFHHDLTQREIANRVGLSQMHVPAIRARRAPHVRRDGHERRRLARSRAMSGGHLNCEWWVRARPGNASLPSRPSKAVLVRRGRADWAYARGYARRRVGRRA